MAEGDPNFDLDTTGSMIFHSRGNANSGAYCSCTVERIATNYPLWPARRLV